MSSTSSKLLVKPNLSRPDYLNLSPESAGWEHLHFTAVNLKTGEQWQFETGENELALIILGGSCDIKTSTGNWSKLGSRADVFHGMPTTLFLSRNTKMTVTAGAKGVDFACGWAKAARDFPARLITPEEVTVELRGGENASRQINRMVPPGFPCDRLVVVEVYTPAGNWSSYPPHKHDERKLTPSGEVLEADLEEIYFYKIDRPEGYAYQRVYTDDHNLDELMLVGNNHLVLSPEGYHPVVAAHGYNTYYLNILAGSDQSLASTDDPAYSWVKANWKTIDSRLPLVKLEMNNK
jgi:5-deoxy-glucuronate isomerase